MTAAASIADRMPALLGRLRLATGLVLFAYVSLHLLNHVAGLASIAAMEAGAMWMYHLLQFAPVTWTLYGALLVHFLLALHAVYRRRRLWPPGSFRGGEPLRPRCRGPKPQSPQGLGQPRGQRG